MSKTILIMAGGTGGHIFPALAVAHQLRDAGWRVVWLGNPEGMEARLVPQHGFEMVWVKFSALRGKGLLRKLLLPVNLLSGFWQALREIPVGSTASYSEIARRIGAPKASRAVAQACAGNMLAVAIPCHRVVRNDGDLSGYRWGVPRKRALLEREAQA